MKFPAAQRFRGCLLVTVKCLWVCVKVTPEPSAFTPSTCPLVAALCRAGICSDYQDLDSQCSFVVQNRLSHQVTGGVRDPLSLCWVPTDPSPVPLFFSTWTLPSHTSRTPALKVKDSYFLW